MDDAIRNETRRRRTFAIISHPDAGKTTLTEKLLLYGGAVRLAGSVTARRNERHARSDWMKMEQKRGISITSTVLQFHYDGHVVNLLDTPGHEDFSEDTYRTLAAVDSVVMLIDSANGIELQTRKLYEVARMRRLPVFTFINKMDRPGREPLELVDEIEREFGIAAFPVVWPIGEGADFRGVYDRTARRVHLFSRAGSGERAELSDVVEVDSPELDHRFGPANMAKFREEISLIDAAGAEFDHEAYLRGELTPVFFGSAVTSFGVELLLDHIVRLAPAPGPRATDGGEAVAPESAPFSGFVFKIQANMDRQHRDRVAFLRVVSGRFERDMAVTNTRTGKKVRLSRPQKLFAEEREVAEEAYPGDVIGLVNPGAFAIGDTVTAGPLVAFEPIPRFSPEQFAAIRATTPSKRKQLLKGLEQLGEEGAIQIFWTRDRTSPDPILAAVGPLQFDVVRFRLEDEYNVETTLVPLGYTIARWITRDPGPEFRVDLRGTQEVEDDAGHRAVLFETKWAANRLAEDHPELALAMAVR
jgi:peptide chain release factor 3